MSYRDPVRRLPAREQWAFVGMGWAPPRTIRRVMRRRIADVLVATPELLNVTRPALVRDIQHRFGVSDNTAYAAIEVARFRMLDLGAPLQLVFTTVERCHYDIRPTFAALGFREAGAATNTAR